MNSISADFRIRRLFGMRSAVAAGCFKQAITALLLFHIVVIAAMAANPALHERMHHDADHEDHDCAVTLFLSGGIHTPLTVAVLAIDGLVIHRELIFFEVSRPPATFARNGILEHAPPVSGTPVSQ
jgi:hypothetical protein